jgi:hypothetical protein
LNYADQVADKLRFTNAVPIVGCPANCISEAGVK